MYGLLITFKKPEIDIFFFVTGPGISVKHRTNEHTSCQLLLITF